LVLVLVLVPGPVGRPVGAGDIACWQWSNRRRRTYGPARCGNGAGRV